jgi:hypothetical protein
VNGGCSLERAGTLYPVYHLASSLCLGYSLSGNTPPMQSMQINVWSPSDCQASSQAGSSLVSSRVQSWMHPRCGRFRVNGYVCDKLSPFPNLSRNLSPPRRFLATPDSAAFNSTAGTSHPSSGS